MQKFKILQKIDFKNILSDISSGSTITKGEPLVLSNDYYVYKTKTGGEIVNDNNVRNFLDKPENSEIAEKFVLFLEENTNFTEFKEIFYDNKKLAYTFNEYYKNNFVPNFNENKSIELSLKNTYLNVSTNNNFKNNKNRIIGLLQNLSTKSITGDSYFIDIKIDQTSKTAPKGDYYEYFKNCIKGTYVDETYSFINNVLTQKIFANIPYITKNKNNNFDFGYSPVNFNYTQTPAAIGMGRDSFNYQFLDFSQFKQGFGYAPKELTNNTSGTFISQDRILISNIGTFTQSDSEHYTPSQLQYSAQFDLNQMLQFDKKTQSAITIPITISLSQPSLGNTYLYIYAESYSTAILGYDFFTNNQLLPYNQKAIVFPHGTKTTNDYIYILNTISPEDTIILTLKDLNNRVLSFLILRCEEFIEINTYKDNSYLLIENNYKNKLFLNCFVDYNYDNDDMEFYRDYNLKNVDNRKI